MRPRAFFVGVGEDADVIETGVGDEAVELGEILLGLAREPTIRVVRNVTPGTRSRIRAEQAVVHPPIARAGASA